MKGKDRSGEKGGEGKGERCKCKWGKERKGGGRTWERKRDRLKEERI